LWVTKRNNLKGETGSVSSFMTAEGGLYVAAVVDLFARRVVGWSMNAAMTAQLVTDARVMAICDGASRTRC
jgi:putative transposase